MQQVSTGQQQPGPTGTGLGGGAPGGGGGGGAGLGATTAATATIAAPHSPGQTGAGTRQQISGGRFDFEDGGTYCGGWEEGKAHGHGVCTGPKHQGAYSGAWNYGFEGSGAYIWPSGFSFEGQWQNGRRHGLGVETRGRWIYRGEWTSGFKGRYGVRQSISSTARYEGTWAGGFQDGYGSETYADGGTYQGQWLSGKRHGYGVRQSAPFGMASHFRPKTIQASMTSLRSNDNGAGDKSASDPADKRNHRIDDVRGGFVLKARSDEAPARRNSLVEKTKKGLLSGLKIRKQRSTGDLEKRGTGQTGSIRSTVSTASWISTGSSQSGMTTKSMHTDSNASFTVEEEQLDASVTEVYMGEWKNDKRDGYGISERSDGLRYEGEWHNNKKHGYGVTTFRDGTREEGKYKCNVLITSQKKRHVFLIRSAKFRERIEAAVSSAQRASKYALQKADIAISRTSTARGKAESADQHAEMARIDSDVAVQTARSFAPDFKPSVLERFERLRTRERPLPPTEPTKVDYLRSEQFSPKKSKLPQQQPSVMGGSGSQIGATGGPGGPIHSQASQHSSRPMLQHQSAQNSFDYPSSGGMGMKRNDMYSSNSALMQQQQQQQQHMQQSSQYAPLETTTTNPNPNRYQMAGPSSATNDYSSPGQTAQLAASGGGGGGAYPNYSTSQQFHQQHHPQQQQQQQAQQQMNYIRSDVSTGSGGNQLYGLNNNNNNTSSSSNNVAANRVNYYNQNTGPQSATIHHVATIQHAPSQYQQQQGQPYQQQQQQQQQDLYGQSQQPLYGQQQQQQGAGGDYYSSNVANGIVGDQMNGNMPQDAYELPPRSGSTSLRRNSRLVNESVRAPMLSSANYAAQASSSIDHFDHYKRPPSRDSSVDRYTRAASRLGGGGAFSGSRQASVDRTLQMPSNSSSGGGTGNGIQLDPVPDRSSRAGSAFRQLPSSSNSGGGTGNGAVMTGMAVGGSRAGTPLYQSPVQAATALYSSPNQPFEDVLLRQRTLGQDIVPSPAQPKRTESLYIGAKAAPLMGGGGGGGGGAISKAKGLKSVPIQVQLQRKKSLPDVQELPRQLGGLMSREEVSALGSARREEVRRQYETSERLKANPLLYLVSPQVKDWFSRQQLVMLVLIVNIALGIMFFKMLT